MTRNNTTKEEFTVSILIEGMKMPTSCLECIGTHEFVTLYQCVERKGFENTYFAKERFSGCPLKVVSEPHGKLVDADKVQRRLEEICRERKITYGSEYGGLAKDLAELCDGLPSAFHLPTAEKETNCE